MILEKILIGPYPYPKDIKSLKDKGVSCILNVAGIGRHQNQDKDISFYFVPIEDLRPIPVNKCKQCFDIILDALNRGDKIYVHCSAGQNRSPTVVWLFMIAYGIDKNEAKEAIEEAYIDSVPGHPLMIDKSLMDWVCKWRGDNCHLMKF